MQTLRTIGARGQKDDWVTSERELFCANAVTPKPIRHGRTQDHQPKTLVKVEALLASRNDHLSSKQSDIPQVANEAATTLQ
jgi:hypothetical protein